MNVTIADRIKSAVTIVSGLIMVYALFVSADHIGHVASLIGLVGYQASTLFVLVDLPALVGKVLRLRYFAAGTRRTGLHLMIASGTLSLACNVTSGWFGGGLGPAGYGAFVVAMFLVMENVVTKIRPSAAVTRAKNTVPATPAVPAASQADEARRAARRERDRKRRAAKRLAEAAPISPSGPAAVLSAADQAVLVEMDFPTR